MLLGVLGMLLLIGAWTRELIMTMRKGYSAVPRKFSFLYFLASSLLTLHAISIGDVVFSVLNLVAAVQALINFAYGW